MSYDDIFKRLGGFGPYQRRIYFLLCISIIPCAFHDLASVFIGAKPDFRCLSPFENGNATFHLNETIRNLTRLSEDSGMTWDSCRRLDTNFTDTYFLEGIPSNSIIECDAWVFDDSEYKSSSVTEFLLICDRAWMRAAADALFMTGVLAGSYIFGDLSDRFGRRSTFMISLVIQLVAGVLTAIAPEYISYVLGRILIGSSNSGVFLVAYVICVEIVGPSKRLYAAVFVNVFFSVSFLLMAGIAYLTADYSWRVFQVVITLLPGAFLMSYWWIIPESSRWLASRGRHQEAKEILCKIAKENGVELPESALDGLLKPSVESPEEIEEQSLENGMLEKQAEVGEKEVAMKKTPQRQPNLIDLMRHPNLRGRSLNITFNWFVNNMVYYGLSWSTSSLGGNDYVNFCLSGIMEFPGSGILLLTLNRYGRKFTLCGALLVGGTSLLLTVFVPKDLNWLTITLTMIGKMAITSSYGAMFVFSAELFPTVVRSVGMGTANMCAQMGGIIAPYVNLLGDYWRPLPFIIFGCLALCAGGAALFLPETLNRKLPETIEEGEDFVEKPRKKPFIRRVGKQEKNLR